MTWNKIPLWFPVLQFFSFKKQLIKEREKKTSKSRTRKKTPSQHTVLNSPALLTRTGEAISLSVFLTDSYLYYLNSGCAEHYSAIALLLKATTISLKTSCVSEGF